MITFGKLSDAAIMRYAKFQGPIAPPDLSDTVALAETRRLADQSGFDDSEKIEFPYSHVEGEIASVPVLRIHGSSAPATDRVLLHFHGGGFILGSARGNASFSTQVAEFSGLEVISVDYRLAPESPFPAGLDDALAVYCALASEYGPGCIGVFGESAGGGLTASLALALRDRGEQVPGALVLVAPFADMTGSGGSIQSRHGVDPELTWDTLRPGAAAYSSNTDPRNPLVSPVFGDYAGLPPTYIQAGGREILLDDARRIADACRDAGVAVELDVWEELWHCWHFDPTLPESRDACERIASFFKRNL